MDKNSIIGFILIAAVMFGFTFYQSREAKKMAEAQAQLDSIAMVEALKNAPVDTARTTADAQAAAVPVQVASIYKDSLLEASHSGEASIITLSNDKFEVAFTTKGAQPYSAHIKDYRTYGGDDLYLFKAGMSEYAVNVYAGELINTSDFIFTVAEKTDTTLVMRLPFSDGGYIQQRYAISEGSYQVKNELSFVGMKSIPRNVSSVDIDFSMVIPRLEKGYKNEAQYSKLDYYFEGDKKPVEMGRSRSASKRIDSRLSWFAFQQQFFSAIIRAPKQFASGELAVNFLGDEDADKNLMSCSAKMRVDILPGQNQVIPMEFYFGPNHYTTLKSYGQNYDKIIPLGGWLVGWFTKYFIIPMFNWLHQFIANFGIIILIMTIVIKLVVLPFTYKSYASSAKMQALKPEMEKINERYPKQEDAMKKQQATMELYKRAGVSPMGGCLPTLFTFPILWAMFRFFPASIELRQQRFLWAEDLSGYDSIVDFGMRVPLIGDHLSLFALLMAVVMFAYSKFSTANTTASNDPNAQSMQFMTVWMMPIMMFFICNSLSSGLSYYYLLSQLIGLVEIFVIRKFVVKPEQVLATLKANSGKPLPKSKWQQRLEEAQKIQQAQQRNARR